MKVLYTDRLVLRPFEVTDTPDVLAAITDPDVARWIPLLPAPYKAADAKSFIELQQGPAADALAVTHKDDLIGCMTIGVELGYWFAKSAWGNGFATEAARAVVGGYFARTQETLQSGYMLGNERSRGVLSKLGFKDTETVVRHSSMLKEDVTIQRMTLVHSDWEARA